MLECWLGEERLGKSNCIGSAVFGGAIEGCITISGAVIGGVVVNSAILRGAMVGCTMVGSTIAVGAIKGGTISEAAPGCTTFGRTFVDSTIDRCAIDGCVIAVQSWVAQKQGHEN